MKVLVAVASKHGSTQEIAYAIGKNISGKGIAVDVKNVTDIKDISGYRGVILGSAVYAGHWLKPALDFAREHEQELARMPTWVFSSGPVGEPLKPYAEKSVNIDAVTKRIKSKEHRVFAGRLEKSRLNFAEKAIVRAVSAAEGDFRDWDEIKIWSDAIAKTLTAKPTPRFARRVAP